MFSPGLGKENVPPSSLGQVSLFSCQGGKAAELRAAGPLAAAERERAKGGQEGGP